MSKILIVHDYLDSYGGAERVLEAIIDCFPDAELFTSRIVSKAIPENTKLHTHLNEFKTTILRLFPSFLPTIILRYLTYLILPFYINQNKYDLIIINTSGPSTWNFFRSDRFVVYYHKVPGMFYFAFQNFLNRLLISILFNINKIFINKVDQFITNSHFNENILIDRLKIEPSKIKVLYPYVTVAEYVKPSTNKDDYFIYIGRLESYKGIEKIIRVCIGTDSKLKVIGRGSLTNKLPIHPNIDYLGYVTEDEKYDLLSKAKALISLAGDRDEFGIVYAESLMCGTPVICLDTGAVHEILNDTNAIFISNNFTDLTNAIYKIKLKDMKISQKDIDNANNKFNINNFTKGLFDIIN